MFRELSWLAARLWLGMEVEFILKLVAVRILRSGLFSNQAVSFLSIATIVQHTGRSFLSKHHISIHSSIFTQCTSAQP